MKNNIIKFIVISLLGSGMYFYFKGTGDHQEISDFDEEVSEYQEKTIWPGGEDEKVEQHKKSVSTTEEDSDEDQGEFIENEESDNPRFAKKKDDGKNVKKESKKKETTKDKDKFDLDKMLSIIDERFKDDDEKNTLRDSLETYAFSSRYPSKLIPLGNSQGSDPLEYKPNSNGGIGGGGQNVDPKPEGDLDFTLFGTSTKDNDQDNFVAGEEPVNFSFELLRKDQPIKGVVKAEVYNDKKEKIALLNYSESKSTGKYSATLENPYQYSSNPVGKYFVKIEATTVNNNQKPQTIKVADSFSLNTKKTRFGSSVTDYLDKEGDLNFEVAYRVFVGGTYLISASLYDNNQKMIAFYEEPIKLERSSKVFVPLEFHGNLFYEKRLNGPFILKNISLNYVNPDLTTEVSGVNTINYQTKNYSWSEFNPNPYVNLEMLDKIQKIDDYLNSLADLAE